jgi:hypothetical protein
MSIVCFESLSWLIWYLTQWHAGFHFHNDGLEHMQSKFATLCFRNWIASVGVSHGCIVTRKIWTTPGTRELCKRFAMLSRFEVVVQVSVCLRVWLDCGCSVSLLGVSIYMFERTIRACSFANGANLANQMVTCRAQKMWQHFHLKCDCWQTLLYYRRPRKHASMCNAFSDEITFLFLGLMLRNTSL